MSTTDATFAIYRNRADVLVALNSFLGHGFRSSALWVFQSKRDGAKDFSQVQRCQLKTGALIGALVGAIAVGGFFAFGMSDPVGGRWLMLFVGVFVGGLFGAAAGTLVGVGTPDSAGKRYGQYLQSGGILVSVHSETPDQIQQAHEILIATGGQDVQYINELKTWEKANLERINIEAFQAEEKKQS